MLRRRARIPNCVTRDPFAALKRVGDPQGQAILACAIARSMCGNSLGSARERRCGCSTLASREAPVWRATDLRTSPIAISMSSNASCCRLHAKIGELTLENDFLEGALSKTGLLGAKR